MREGIAALCLAAIAAVLAVAFLAGGDEGSSLEAAGGIFTAVAVVAAVAGLAAIAVELVRGGDRP